MKYCHTCRRFRKASTKFCGDCGRSFNVRYCPRLHANSRSTDYCEHCGSSDLSTPDPVPAWESTAMRIAVVAAMACASVAVFWMAVWLGPTLIMDLTSSVL